jgi:hypothetical protein
MRLHRLVSRNSSKIYYGSNSPYLALDGLGAVGYVTDLETLILSSQVLLKYIEAKGRSSSAWTVLRNALQFRVFA